jgi:hypothetical protein
MTAGPHDPGDTTRPTRETRGVERRSTLATGVLLVIAGAAFLLARTLGIDLADAGWPLFVIVPGLILSVMALVVGGRPGAGLAAAGGIVTSTGLVLAVQNATGLWATWAYAWALVAPGGAGLGLLLYGLLTGRRDVALSGAWTLLVGLVLFIVFAFFFESVVGLSGRAIEGLDTILAVALVALGAVVIAFGLVGRRRTEA